MALGALERWKPLRTLVIWGALYGAVVGCGLLAVGGLAGTIVFVLLVADWWCRWLRVVVSRLAYPAIRDPSREQLPPCFSLYLRGFGDDAKTVQDEEHGFESSHEDRLARHMTRIAPPVKVRNNTDRWRGRDFWGRALVFDDTSWEAGVRTLVDESCCVVVSLSGTPGLIRELEILAHDGGLHHSMLVYPPVPLEGRKQLRTTILDLLGPGTSSGERELATIIRQFDPERSCAAIPLRAGGACFVPRVTGEGAVSKLRGVFRSQWDEELAAAIEGFRAAHAMPDLLPTAETKWWLTGACYACATVVALVAFEEAARRRAPSVEETAGPALLLVAALVLLRIGLGAEHTWRVRLAERFGGLGWALLEPGIHGLMVGLAVLR